MREYAKVKFQEEVKGASQSHDWYRGRIRQIRTQERYRRGVFDRELLRREGEIRKKKTL